METSEKLLIVREIENHICKAALIVDQNYLDVTPKVRICIEHTWNVVAIELTSLSEQLANKKEE